MMIKFLLLPIILVGCTAPVTDPPAHADIMQDYQTLMKFARKNVQYQRNQKRQTEIPSMLDDALGDFYNGTNDPTKSEELLQLPSS